MKGDDSMASWKRMKTRVALVKMQKWSENRRVKFTKEKHNNCNVLVSGT